MEILSNPLEDVHKADEIWGRVRPDLNPYPEVRTLNTSMNYAAQTAEVMASAPPVSMPGNAAEAAPMPEVTAMPAPATAETPYDVLKEALPSLISEIIPTLPLYSEITQAIETANAIINIIPGTAAPVEVTVNEQVINIAEEVSETVVAEQDIQAPQIPIAREAIPAAPVVEEAVQITPMVTESFSQELESLINGSIERSKYFTVLGRLALSASARNAVNRAYRGEKRAEQKLNTAYYVLNGENYCPDTPSAPLIYCFRDGVRAAYISEREAAQEYEAAAVMTDDTANMQLMYELADCAHEREKVFMRML